MTSTDRGTRLDRADVLLGLFHCWESIDELLSALSDQQWQAASALPGWRVQDVVAHMIGTESMLLGIRSPESDIDVFSLPHVHNDIGALNERWIRHFAHRSGREVMERFRVVTDDRRRQLAETTNEEWVSITPTPAGPDTYGRFMRIRTFDCWMHEHDIREPLGIRAADDLLAGDSARLALDEVVSSMGYIVGKLGGAPDGSRIAFELTGPLQRTIRVAVDGRGRVVKEFDGGSATATITMDGVLFTRLVGGRTAAPEHRGAIEISGDTDVAQRVVDRLKFAM
ncbi:MAG: maleylpyruvate isomerase family mycothiol-dependent enzyme [Mycobacteriaceae bacterium]|nr:maleylpyruvate isomerase family mycothiol-dependent enzyme [Mycobacteriaceae bacterium]